MTAGRTGGAPSSEAELRLEIERARTQLAGTASALRDQFQRATDVRTWIRRRPAVALGLAFFTGVWLGARRHR